MLDGEDKRCVRRVEIYAQFDAQESWKRTACLVTEFSIVDSGVDFRLLNASRVIIGALTIQQSL